MVFSSPLFLFGFLPVVLALYFMMPPRAVNTIALVASVFFYAWG
jgi:alginate O-acetyltransferase complex protein AlgI